MGRDFVKWFKNTGLGFAMEDQIPIDVKPSLMEYLDHTNKIGVYVYHVYTEVNDKLQLNGMRIGYYVRGKNPFKWNFHSTAGNRYKKKGNKKL